MGSVPTASTQTLKAPMADQSPHAPRLKAGRRPNGFSLLEVLIALVVIAIGVLGAASLITASVQNQQIAEYRSQAMFAAQSLADSIRANWDAAGGPPTHWDSPTVAPHAGCRDGSGCNAADMAADSLWLIDNVTGGQLPEGAVYVCRDDTPEDGVPADPPTKTTSGCTGTAAHPLVVKTFWRDRDNATQRFWMEVQP